jgi:DDE superfamily endonuclease
MKPSSVNIDRKVQFSKELLAVENMTVVSLDECYFSENVMPLRGYSMKGTRLVIEKTTMKRQGRSLLMAVSDAGKVKYVVNRGAVNKTIFRNFIEQLDYPRGTRIVLDNVAFHKNNHDLFGSKGYFAMFCPPYSPEYNPIENLFSKIKHTFRVSLLDDDASVEQHIDKAIANLNDADINNCFQHQSKVCLATLQKYEKTI